MPNRLTIAIHLPATHRLLLALAVLLPACAITGTQETTNTKSAHPIAQPVEANVHTRTEGLVLEIGEAPGQTLFVLDIGSERGLTRNSALLISRDGKLIAEARVERVEPDMSFAVLTDGKGSSHPRVGDRVQVIARKDQAEVDLPSNQGPRFLTLISLSRSKRGTLAMRSRVELGDKINEAGLPPSDFDVHLQDGRTEKRYLGLLYWTDKELEQVPGRGGILATLSNTDESSAETQLPQPRSLILRWGPSGFLLEIVVPIHQDTHKSGQEAEGTAELVPAIHAEVTAYDAETRTLVLNVGALDGVEMGYTFIIYRGARYKGKVRVIRVLPKSCMAVEKVVVDGNVFEVGDSAATKL
jgi:hypothetical protein